jgi:hypothetical protein
MVGVSIPIIYGEGRDKALRRLRREVFDIPIGKIGAGITEKTCIANVTSCYT